jgi:hypothetical protein
MGIHQESNLISYNINSDMKPPLAESRFNRENHQYVNNQNQREPRKSLPQSRRSRRMDLGGYMAPVLSCLLLLHHGGARVEG